MNNKNKILVGCLALLLVLSVGYAIFSDTITINGTATAKGEFSTSMTCGITDDNQLYSESSMGGIENATISCEDSVVTSAVTLTRPKSSIWFYIEVENTGTIPYKLKSVENLDTGVVADVNNSEDIFANNFEKKIAVQIYPDGLSWDGIVENGYTEPGYWVNGTWDDFIFNNIIIPGGKQIFYINAWWTSVENQPSVDEGVSITGRFKLNFEQITN